MDKTSKPSHGPGNSAESFESRETVSLDAYLRQLESLLADLLCSADNYSARRVAMLHKLPTLRAAMRGKDGE